MLAVRSPLSFKTSSGVQKIVLFVLLSKASSQILHRSIVIATQPIYLVSIVLFDDIGIVD